MLDRLFATQENYGGGRSSGIVLDMRHALMQRVAFCISQSITARIVSAGSLFNGHVYVRKADGYGLMFLLLPALQQYWSRLHLTTLLEPPTLQPWLLHHLLPRNHLRTEPAQERGLASRRIRIRRWHTGTRDQRIVSDVKRDDQMEWRRACNEIVQVID